MKWIKRTAKNMPDNGRQIIAYTIAGEFICMEYNDSQFQSYIDGFWPDSYIDYWIYVENLDKPIDI